MNEQYSISLGVILETDDLQRIRNQINNLEADPIKVQLDISQVQNQINNIRRELQGLGSSRGSVSPLSLDTANVERSLNEIASTIREIKASLGSMNGQSGMKSLLTSVNQINAALERTSNQFVELNTQLSSLAGRNFGINIGLNMGGSGNAVSRNAAYGNIARNETIPQLQQQAAALEAYLARYYKVADGLVAAQKLIQGTNVIPNGGNMFNIADSMLDNTGALSSRIAAYKQYIAIIKEAAAVKGIDLTPVTSTFTQSADQIAAKAQNVQSGAAEMEESFKRLQSLFSSGIDAERLSQQLDSIVVDLGEIKTALQGLSQNSSLNTLTTSFNNLSASLERLVENATRAQGAVGGVSNTNGTGAGTRRVIQDQNELAHTTEQTANTVSQSGQRVQKAFAEMARASNLDPVNLRDDISEADELAAAITRLRQLMSSISKIQIGQVNTSKGVQELKILETQLESLSAEWNETVTEINARGGMGLPQMEQLRGKMEATAATIERLKGKIVDVKAKLASDIQANFGNYDAQIVSLETKFNSLANKPEVLRSAIENLKLSLSTLKSADNTEALITANENYKRVLKEVESQLRLNAAAEQQSNNAVALTQAKQNLALKMNNWLKENSAAAKKFGADIQNLQVQLNNCGNIAGVNQISRAFDGITLKAKEASVATLSFGDRLKKQFSQYSAYFSVYMVFMYAIMALRDMFEQVKSIDTAMTELKKVTNETADSYNGFLTNAASKAKELGTTIDGLVESTADFARLGYGFEESQGLAEIANIYAVVGDEIEGVDEATKSLISTLAAFKEQQSGLSNEDFAMDIIDKFNEVGNNFSISSGGIGEALTRSASSLAAANNTLDESIALITAANTVVQNPEVVGTAFKTMSMRIRGAKTELEEAGLETEGMVESTAKLRSEILALSGVDIMEDNNTFKSTYKIMDELAQKWEDLSDIQQATITELIAGKRQGNVVSSLMTNFDTAREALETSLDSEGSAMAEHEKWMKSLEAGVNKVKAAWQSLSQSFMSSDFLRGLLSGVASLANGLGKLFDTFGTLPTLITAVMGGISLFKNQGFFTFDAQTKSIQLFGNSLTNLKTNIGKVSTGISTYNANLKQSTGLQKAYIGAIGKTNPQLAAYLSGLNGTKASMGGYIASLIGAKVATIALRVATMALNMVLTMGIGMLISYAVEGVMKLINAKKELAEQVDELISKFEEEHKTLQKLKGDYDTSNEDSMISRYEKLSKGVDSLGRNVSLTADEYSEYHSIVNKIADQIPSLVSGYDAHGNAILSCKGNVEELTEAYEKLIHAQNQEILTNAGNIEEDFANTVKDKNSQGLWKTLLHWSDEINVGDTGLFSIINNFTDYDMTTDAANALEDLLNTNDDELRKKIASLDSMTQSEIKTALESAGVDVSFWDIHGTDALEETLKNDPEKIKGIIDKFFGTFEEAVNRQKAIAQAKLSEAFDISSVTSGLNYGNISEDLQAVAYQVVGSLDKDFFDKLQADGKTVEQWTTEMLNQLNSIGKDNNAQIEAAFDLQTKFNGGEIPYGEYVNGLEDTGKLIDSLNLKDEVESQLKLSLGLDEDGLVAEYQQLRNRLASNEYFDIMPSEYVPFIEGLSAEELSVLIDIIPELEETKFKETIDDVKSALKLEMMLQGLTFDLNIEVETTGIEALNTAMKESVSASGLSSDSIKALKSRYSELEMQGYDLSVLFEETSHGIHLNRQEFNKLEKAYATDKLTKVDGELDEMKSTYDDLGEAIKNTDDPVKKAELYNDRQTLAKRINEAATLAAQYEGLTSAYNDWLAAEEAGQERDMYENVIEGFENIGDEISRGWYDDGTIKFLEMLTGRTDLAGKSAKELKEIYKGLDKSIKYIGKDGKVLEDTGYSVRDFFTVDDEGNSTSDGVYNFLDAIGKLEEEAFGGKDVVKRDKNGKVIAFDFGLAIKRDKDGNIIKNGDEAIAEALGISEELVQIMVRAADDAGFVVSMDGTYKQLADLQNEARASADYLKEIGKTDFDFDFNTSSLTSLNKQLDEAHKILEDPDFWNKDGTFNFDAKGATEAMQVVSTLQAKVDKLSEEKYGIGLTVEDEEFEEPLENLQEYGRTVQTLNQLRLNPEVNAERIEELEGNLKEISEYFANLDEETKVELGFESDDNWEEVKKKIENGEVTIPTVLDIQANMDKNIQTLTDLALLGSGLLSEKEEEAIVKKYKIEAKADEVDTTDVEEKTENAVIDGLGNPILSRETNIEIIAETFGIEDVDDLSSKLEGLDDATVQAIAEAVGQGDVEALDLAIAGMDGNVVDAVCNALGYDSLEELKTAIRNMQGNEVDAKVDTSGQAEKVWTLQDVIDGLKGKTVDIVVNTVKTVKTVFKNAASAGKEALKNRFGIGETNGTANVNGTTGKAYKRGSWGTKNSGTALVGELGREVLVRDGRYYTIGDNGAEFIHYKKGDIIFNHIQSEELFKNGKVTANGGRARAFVNGTAFSSGSGGDDTNHGGTAVGSNDKDKKETFDWIEIAISRLERVIDNLDKTVNSVYKSWDTRNSALIEEITRVGHEIGLQEQAAKTYLNKANSIKFDEYNARDGVNYAALIRGGTIKISDITDEELKEKIKEYQEWYEKYLSCIDAAEDLKQIEAELYEQRFENVQSQYDGILQGFEHTESMLNEYISQAEAEGHIVSKSYYQALIDNEKSNIAELRKEQADLIAKRDEAVASGAIVKGSEAWLNMCAEIDGVTQAIEEGTTTLIEYDNAMRDIDWQVFDLIQERISDVTEEADFLIELMSNAKLFDDNGKLTDKGMATMGLHGQNYNAYMYQADEYANEIVELDKQIAKDPYDQELINRRRELVELQRESILAAEDEKQAIKDLVEEGINLELEALQERIDLHNEELDSMKDLYDYQKNVQEQTENIASLQKQLRAYEGFDDEETRAAVQKLKVELESAQKDLEETQYDKYISDQSALLDELYLEYENLLNTRLDDTNGLITQVIDAVNIAAGAEGTIATALGSEGAIAKELVANGITIKTTLENEAKSVGATISTAMKGIWSVDEGNAKSVLETYGKGFQDKQTTTNTVLGDIKTYIGRMVDDVDKDAQTKTTANKTSTSAKKDPTKNSSGSNKASFSSGGNKSASGDGNPKVGDKVKFLSGKYYYDSQGVTPAGSKNHGKQVYITNINKRSWATHPYHISTGKKLGQGDLGWLKLNQLSGYATGKKNFLDNEIAWTQENGQEFIVRPSDGAILTPIAKGDSVLTSAASSNIWDMANSPAEFIKDNLNLGIANAPNNSNVNNSYSQHIDNVVFRMDNVKNYEEFLCALRDDRRFEKLVTAMTIDRIAGGSSLAKGKSIR